MLKPFGEHSNNFRGEYITALGKRCQFGTWKENLLEFKRFESVSGLDELYLPISVMAELLMENENG